MTRRRSSPPRSRRAPSGQGRLRIIGGRFRRRLLAVPDHPGLRPTPDRVRETLFNWLAFDIAERRVLDLFAGTGALGLEALSRGAREALFVEADSKVARALEANLALLDAPGQVVAGEALDWLQNQTVTAPVELVFLDPPFHRDLVTSACTHLETRGWLTAEAWVYVETEARLALDVPGNWTLHREVAAGESRGRLYRRRELLS
jgi:16S rRNA (guanine966-N2)-methyltransferase